MTEPSDLDRLLTAAKDCQQILAAFVGVPHDPSVLSESLHQYDPAKRDFVLVDPEQIPAVTWRATVMALDMLSVAVGFSEMEGSSGSFEEQVAALLRQERKP
jgi:hypothetical protein